MFVLTEIRMKLNKAKQANLEPRAILLGDKAWNRLEEETRANKTIHIHSALSDRQGKFMVDNLPVFQELIGNEVLVAY